MLKSINFSKRSIKNVLEKALYVFAGLLAILVIWAIVYTETLPPEEKQDLARIEFVQELNLENGEYSVIEVRETSSGTRYDVYYKITLVVEGENGRKAVSYTGKDAQDYWYLSCAKLIPGDAVEYNNGVFTIK